MALNEASRKKDQKEKKDLGEAGQEHRRVFPCGSPSELKVGGN